MDSTPSNVENLQWKGERKLEDAKRVLDALDAIWAQKKNQPRKQASADRVAWISPRSAVHRVNETRRVAFANQKSKISGDAEGAGRRATIGSEELFTRT